METSRTLKIVVRILCAMVMISKGAESLSYDGTVKVEDFGLYKVTAYVGVMHHDTSKPKSCGKINSQAGFLFFEAIRFAVRQINKNSSYLSGVHFGYRVINTCKNTLILKDLLADGILDPTSVGVIGPPTSDEAIFSAPIFNIFGIPMISYMASSMDLEDRERYSNFYRTVPSDSYQVFALIEIIKAFNWTYVYAINSHGNFGERGMDFFVSAISSTDICIAKRVTLLRKTNAFYYQYVIRTMMAEKNIRVVVLYTAQEDTKALLLAAKRLGVPPGRYVWIGSTSFGPSLSPSIDDIADGAIFLGYQTKRNKDFMDYMYSLKPETENFPWFRMFWEDVFKCSLNPNATNKCSGNESLANINLYEGNSPISPIQVAMTAVNTFACGIRKLFEENCPNITTRSLCVRDTAVVNGLKVRNSIRRKLKSNSLYCGPPFPSAKFSYDGSVPGRFTILNFQYNGTKRKIEEVGYWQDNSFGEEAFQINKSKIEYGNGSKKRPVAICASSCGIGEISQPVIINPKCCWECFKCSKSQYVFNNTCVECPIFNLPTGDKTECYRLPIKFVDMRSNLSIAALIFCFIGVKLTTVTLGIFLKFWETRVVKASSRELSTVMIIGLYMCFMSPIFFVTEPTAFVCAVQRFIVGVCLTTCYTPLLLKTNRIYRIFESAKKGLKRPTLVSPKSQVMICLGLIALQCLLVIAWVAGNPPRTTKKMDPETEFVRLACSHSELSMAFNLGLCGILMLCCTYFAIKTRKFPKNYNESRSIGITMYLTCFLWGVFIPLYAYSAGNDVTRVYYLSMFCILIAYVTLIGLFGQRIYILLFVKGGKSEERSQSNSSEPRSAYMDAKYKIAKLSPAKGAGCKCQHQKKDSPGLDRSAETDNEDI